VIQSVVKWLGVFSPILIGSGLVLAMWISLPHGGEFALTGREKLLRMIVFVCVLVALFLLIFYVSELGHKPIGWDDTAL